MYQKEIEQQKVSIRSLEAQNSCPHDIRKQVFLIQSITLIFMIAVERGVGGE